MDLSGMRIAQLGLVEGIAAWVRSKQTFESANIAHLMEVLHSPLAHGSTKIRLDWSKRMQHKKATRQVSGQARLEPAMKELVDVVSSLRQLLLDYGPLWYKEETDARVHNALAEADSALTASEKESRRPRSLEFVSALPNLSSLHHARHNHGCK
jgi:hypothetical protein